MDRLRQTDNEQISGWIGWMNLTDEWIDLMDGYMGGKWMTDSMDGWMNG